MPRKIEYSLSKDWSLGGAEWEYRLTRTVFSTGGIIAQQQHYHGDINWAVRHSKQLKIPMPEEQKKK